MLYGGMSMKIRVAIPFVLCIIMTICSVVAVLAYPSNQAVNAIGSDRELIRLDEAADQLYKAAYTNNRQAGYKYVQQVEKLLQNDEMRQTGQSAGWQLLQASVQSIEASLENGRLQSDWLTAAASIHLTTDALLRPSHALWLQYEKVMLEDLHRINVAWKRQTGDGAIAARAAMNSFTAHLSRIEAAAAMQRPHERIEELNERIRYTNVLLEAGMKGQTKQDWTDDSIDELRAALTRVFSDGLLSEEEPVIAPLAAANPISWTFLIGAIIMAVLAFTAWRKYRQEPYGVKPLS